MKRKKIVISGIVLVLLSATGYFLVTKSVNTNDEKEPTVIVEKGSEKPVFKLNKNEKIDMQLKDNRTAYYLNVTLDSEKKKIYGYEKVKIRNNYNSSLSELVFHLYPDSYNSAETRPSIGEITKELKEYEIGDIVIDSLKVKGSKRDYTQENQILKISLGDELKPGEIIEVDMEFTLKIPKDKDRLGQYKNQYSITNWYPILSIYDEKTAAWDENPFHPVGESNYSDCSDYKVDINVEKGMILATTGVKTDEKAEGLLESISFEADNIRDFVFFASKDYEVISKEVDGIKVNSYYLKEEGTAKRMLNLASESLKFFNSTYGKYPYPEYDVVESYLEGGAMEYPNVTQMGPYREMNEEYRGDQLSFYDEAVVHETAHQWFYSTIGNNEFKEPVLDETFTSYATALFFESQFGEYNPMAVKSAFLRYPMRSQGPIYRSTDKYSWNDFGMVVYKLGPVVLEDLRRQVGAEKFIDIFRTYYETYKFKNASLEGFIKIVEEKCGSGTGDYVRAAFTSSNYSMDSMVVSQDELKKITGQ